MTFKAENVHFQKISKIHKKGEFVKKPEIYPSYFLRFFPQKQRILALKWDFSELTESGVE